MKNMSCEKIKFRAKQNPVNTHIEIEVYRELRDNNEKAEWIMTDRFNELSINELRCLGEYINNLFKKKNT